MAAGDILVYEMKNSLKLLLLRYKRRKLLQAAVVGLLFYLWWSFVSERGVNDFLSGMIAIAVANYLTMNVIFEKNYYPLDLFVDDFFPDKKSFGNKFFYVGVYVFFIFVIFRFVLLKPIIDA